MQAAWSYVKSGYRETGNNDTIFGRWYGLNFHFAKKGQLVPVGQAEEGDIVFFQFDDDAQPDHVGIVFKNDGKNLICLEGNTSGDGKGSQSNGDGAFKKKRPYKMVMAVVRPAYKD